MLFLEALTLNLPPRAGEGLGKNLAPLLPLGRRGWGMRGASLGKGDTPYLLAKPPARSSVKCTLLMSQEMRTLR